MKKVIICMLTILLLASFCACGKTAEKETGTVTVKVRNTVPDKITVLAASWQIDGNTVGTTAVEIAGERGCLGKDYFTFYVNSDDVEDEKDLQKLGMTIKITEKDGGTFDAAKLSIPSKFGDRYDFELRYEDGTYSVWQIFDGGVSARLAG